MAINNELLILDLARGVPVREAANRAGCAVQTVNRKLQNAEFRERVLHARNSIFAKAAGRLAGQATKAAEKLKTLMNEANSDHVKLSAARSILEFGPRLHEGIELAEQIRLLREEVEALKRNGTANNDGTSAECEADQESTSRADNEEPEPNACGH